MSRPEKSRIGWVRDRVKLRGGSWINNPENCRSAYRNRNEPGNRNNNIGCRVCFCLHFQMPFPATQNRRLQVGSERGAASPDLLIFPTTRFFQARRPQLFPLPRKMQRIAELLFLQQADFPLPPQLSPPPDFFRNRLS